MSGTGQATLNSQLRTMNTLAVSLDDSMIDWHFHRPSIKPIEAEVALAAVKQDVFSAANIDDVSLDKLLDQPAVGSRRNHKAVAAVADAVRPHFDTQFNRLMEGSLSQDEPLDPQQLLIAAGFNIVNPEIAMRVFSSVMDRSQQPPVSADDGQQYIVATSRLHGAPIDLNGMESTFQYQHGTKLIPWDGGSQGLRGVDVSWHTLMFNTGTGGVYVGMETADPLVFRGIWTIFEARLKSEEPVIDRKNVWRKGINRETVENRIGLEPILNWLTGLRVHLGFDISYSISSEPVFRVRNGRIV